MHQTHGIFHHFGVAEPLGPCSCHRVLGNRATTPRASLPCIGRMGAMGTSYELGSVPFLHALRTRRQVFSISPSLLQLWAQDVVKNTLSRLLHTLHNNDLCLEIVNQKALVPVCKTMQFFLPVIPWLKGIGKETLCLSCH